jgi:hypothetical protein
VTLSIGTTPWAREALTPDVRAELEEIVPTEIGHLTLGAERHKGDWSARLYRDRRRHGDPLGVSRHARTLVSATAAAVRDYRMGPFLAWCSLCAEPATTQISGEAYCAAHEASGERIRP